MEQKKMRLPVGINDFAQIRTENYYYVDKTSLIRDLLRLPSKVTLFARPHHFGLTLNLSMLEHFFSPGGDKTIFDGLEISKEKDLCEKYMGKYPVISLSMKEIGGETYEEAYRKAADLIVSTAEKFRFLLDSEKLSDLDRKDYRDLLDRHMDSTTLRGSLERLTDFLAKHFGKDAIVLIDEYDAPLIEAVTHGYHSRMMSLIASLLGAVLKSNYSLEFAVLTGRVQIIEECLFSNLNNWILRPVSDKSSAGYFGFTEEEVEKLFSYYGCSDRCDTAGKWYGGYQFGNTEIFCPRDVVTYCSALLDNPAAQPQNYWTNDSEESGIRRFVESYGWKRESQIEKLIAGETIVEEIDEGLTCTEICDPYRAWSMVFAAGYVTQRGEESVWGRRLAIPNLEMRDVFERQMLRRFEEELRADPDILNRFHTVLLSGNTDEVKELFKTYLGVSSSLLGIAPNRLKQNFYDRLLTVLNTDDRWRVKSSREDGDDTAEILAVSGDGRTGIVFGMKYAQDGDLKQACRDALSQMECFQSADAFQDDGVETVLKYAVGCYQDRCEVLPG